MLSHIDTINKIFSVGTIILQIVALVLFLNFIFLRRKNNVVLLFFKKYTFIFGFIVSLLAVLLSLFYSEIVGYPPCELCWIQRIFLYPQLILFSMELYKKDKSIVDFSVVFAIIGSLVSIYHIYVEKFGSNGFLCGDPSTGGISCSIRYIYEFGYVTMPLMALTLSLFILAILLNFKYLNRE